QISRDWGGKAYTDLMNGLDAALAHNYWLDSTRMGAAGGSYGGYMTNWIAGHSNRFKALFTHAGVFNLENMYGATEEIWFSDWEFGGPYWNKAAMDSIYRRWSPHLFAANFHTPHLVVVGELDFRVPYTQGAFFVHCSATSRSAESTDRFSGRGALDWEAAEPTTLVVGGARVVHEVLAALGQPNRTGSEISAAPI